MKRTALVLILVAALAGCSHFSRSATTASNAPAPAAAPAVAASPATPQSFAMAPPAPPYKPVSSLVALPNFLPGLGTLYVVPATLPQGPFLAYDRDGRLVSSVYMIPVKDFEAHKNFPDLTAAKDRIDHVSVEYNAGHPGVPEPHYHVIVWYISPTQAAMLK